MLVKVARLGNTVSELALTDNSTVQDALDAADLAVENEDVRVNSSTSNTSATLHDGDVVTLVPKVKGGQKIVKVARLGSQVTEVAVSDSASVQDALDAVGLEVENEDIRIGGRSVNAGDGISNGDLITIVPKVKGGK